MAASASSPQQDDLAGPSNFTRFRAVRYLRGYTLEKPYFCSVCSNRILANIGVRKLPAEETHMDSSYRATLLISRENRAPTKRELPPVVDLGVLGFAKVWKKTGCGGLGQQTELITARTSPRSGA